MIKTYIEWIEADLEDIDQLYDELAKWQKIYKKRVFDREWPRTIKSAMDGIRSEIVRHIDQCQHYLKRIEEIENDKTGSAQPDQNQENAGSAGPSAGDPHQELAGTEQETMGPPPEETDDFGSQNLER